MKHIFILFMALLPFLGYAQDTEKEAVHRAIENGNAKALASHLASGVDLSLKDVEGVYSRDQAVLVLSRFFANHTPSKFTKVHEGKSKSDDFFYIGNLDTEKGRFRVTFFLKKIDKAYFVKQLRIETLE